MHGSVWLIIAFVAVLAALGSPRSSRSHGPVDP